MNRARIAEENEMAFSPENQDWVRNEIHAILDKALKGIKPPSGFKKALYVLREFGVLAVNFTIITTLAIFAATQWSAANRRLADDAITHTKSDDRLKAIEGQLTGLRALIASSQPTRKQNQDSAKELLAEARQNSIPAIPIPVVEQAGNAFIEAAKVDPKAWGVALEFVSYRTSLNQQHDAPQITNPRLTDEYNTHIRSEGPPTGLSVLRSGVVPIERAARYEPIGEGTSPRATGGPEFLIVENHPPTMSLRLDGMHIRNTIFKNATIEYLGGPAILENVYFINCTFKMKLTPESERLGTTILAAVPTAFRSAT